MSQQIMCVSTTITSPFHNAVMQGVEETVVRNGYVFSALTSMTAGCEFESIASPGRYDGLILLTPNGTETPLVRALQESDLPIVVFWDWGTPSQYPSVTVDFQGSIGEAVGYLIELGHAQIGYVGYTPGFSGDTNPRLVGFLAAMAQHGLEVTQDQIELGIRHDDMEDGYAAAARLFRRTGHLTALVASNDLLAIGAMKWLRDSGIRVPEDCSVVGFDDISFAAMTNPSLTTVHVPKHTIGRQLAQLLLQLIQGEPLETTRVEVPTRLVIRESTGPNRLVPL
jgi:DNA-binding LacI/PurR family transcriptional regulator